MSSSNLKKTNLIREMLLKTVEKDPDLFCYYVSIMEAKELLGKKLAKKIVEDKLNREVKFLAEG